MLVTVICWLTLAHGSHKPQRVEFLFTTETKAEFQAAHPGDIHVQACLNLADALAISHGDF